MKNRIKVSKKYLIEKYVEEGKSMTEIAKEIGCAYSSINRLIKLHGIKPRSNGEGKIKDISNKKFGKLTALEIDHFQNNCYGWKIPMWRCKCSCGNIHVASYHHIRNGKVSRCRNCANKSMRIRGELTGTFWGQIKKSAQKRNLELNISKNEAYELLMNQNIKCALSNLKLHIAPTVAEHNRGGSSASLDRINNNKNYSSDNVQWIHKDINKMKWKFDLDYFLFLCICVYYNSYLRKNIYNKKIESKKLLNGFVNRYSYRYRDKVKELPFKINRDQLEKMYEKQNRKCRLSGLPIYFTSSYETQKFHNTTASLDRINSDKGYVLNNVQWVHKHINRMKNNLSQNRFIFLCKNIVENMEQDRIDNIFKLFIKTF